MLLSEMVRKLEDEELIYTENVQRSVSQENVWEDKVTVQFTLTKPQMILYSYGLLLNAIGKYITARLKVDDTYYIGGETNTGSGSTIIQYRGMFWLSAGSHTIVLQLKSSYVSTANSYLQGFTIGKALLNDCAGIALQGYGSGNVSVSARKTCVGLTRATVLYVQVYAETTPTLTIDGETKNLVNDSGYKYTFCEALSLGNHTVSVNVGYFTVVSSPWILPKTDAKILHLNFPQGSTIYIVAEPLFSNPTKILKIGKKRAMSFGDSSDFYIVVSGTDIVELSFTFEKVEVAKSILYVSGNGGCISIIGVDVR